MLAEGDEEESFEIWAELPSENAIDPLSTQTLPIAFEFKPRSYLELGAVRVVTPARLDEAGSAH